ncbi:MAG: hypothetical protein JJU09_08525 [Rhodobacteraceae bacterium]|nr:hypothetical protein [Paracoccaceae bacterium]TVR44021.1 MAG: hypothetical protein EA386_14890 [Paracoccaceae bacterium]
MPRTALVLVLATAGLTGCAQRDSADVALDPPPNAEYLSVDTLLLDDNTVNFLVQMRGARGREDVVRYARCAAAQYALIRGYSFAQHVRTNVERQGSLWLGDGGFVISPDLPRGVRNMDAEVIVDDCIEQGIPTV